MTYIIILRSFTVLPSSSLETPKRCLLAATIAQKLKPDSKFFEKMMIHFLPISAKMMK